MKKIVFPLVTIYFLAACSGPKVSHDEALAYYGVIGVAYSTEKKSSDEFIALLKESIGKAQENNPQRIDSIDIIKLQNGYQKFISKLDSDLIKLAALREVDSEINLRANFVNDIKLVDSSLKTIIPETIILLKNGLETMTDKDEKRISEFRKTTEEQKKRNGNIERLSEQFMIKYNIQANEVEKFGLY